MKQWSLRYSLFVLAVCLLASLLAAGCGGKTKGGAAGGVVPENAGGGPRADAPPAEPEPAEFGAGFAIRRPPKAVDLTYNDKNDACAQDWAGDVCVQTISPNAAIWKGPGNSGKPKKVRWWIDDAQSGTYWWEIEYKGPDGEDWLGRVSAITCNDNHTTSKKPNPADLPPGTLTWEYRIKVYKCTALKTKGDCLCKTDPRIEIHP